MRIYAAADIHGIAEKIALVRKNTTDFKPDVIVLDFDSDGSFRKKMV